VKILTKMGIPIFVAPQKGYAEAKIEAARVENGKLAFDVRNSGNVHFSLEGVKLHGMGSNGESLFDRQLDGWYVLAGTPRTYSVEIPAASCSKLKKIVIEAQTDISGKGTVTKELEVSPALCR